MPRLCEVHPGICLTTEEIARKNFSQGSRRMPVGKEYTEQSTHVNKTIRIRNLQNQTKYTKHTTIYETTKKRTKRTSQHNNTSLHFTQLHFTTLIDTSLPQICTSLPSHLSKPIYVSYRSISPHITKLDTVQFFHLQTYFRNNEPLDRPKEPLTVSLHFTFFSLILSTFHFTLL
jgi:hypothetical protein